MEGRDARPGRNPGIPPAPPRVYPHTRVHLGDVVAGDAVAPRLEVVHTVGEVHKGGQAVGVGLYEGRVPAAHLPGGASKRQAGRQASEAAEAGRQEGASRRGGQGEALLFMHMAQARAAPLGR